MVSRRRFITVGAAVAATGVVTRGTYGGVPAIANAVEDVENTVVSADSIRKLVGNQFVIRDRLTGRKEVVRLIEVKDFSNPSDKELGIQRESYSLLFEGRKEYTLDQGVYEFINGSMPDSMLFVVPVTPDQGIYEVNFNSFKS